MLSVAMVVGLCFMGGIDAPSRVALFDGVRFSGYLLAQAATDAIDTVDGKTVVGRIVDENTRGYLFQPEGGSPILIEYGRVRSVRRGSKAAAVASPAVPAAPTAPAASTPNIAKLEEIEAQLQAARVELDNYPTGGAVAMVVLGAVGFVGATPWAIIYSGQAAKGAGDGEWMALFWPLAVISLAVLIVGIVLVVRNGGPHRALKLRIEALEEKREIYLERRTLRVPDEAPGQRPTAFALSF